MPKQMIEIVPATRRKKIGNRLVAVTAFRVRYYGANGEILAVSEVLNTRNNARKNIKAMEILMSGSPQVVDKTTKK